MDKFHFNSSIDWIIWIYWQALQDHSKYSLKLRCCDYCFAKVCELFIRSHFLIDNNEEIPSYKLIEKMKGRRFINAHLPLKLLPPSIIEQRVKTIYVARNPKDVVVSYYYHNQLFRFVDKSKDFQTYFDYFVNDLRRF